jgi:prevent-host-death family protein
MRTISARDATLRLPTLLHEAQREPVVIRNQEGDIAVLVSIAEYDRLRNKTIEEFEQFCDKVSEEAKARGMNDSVLQQILHG